MSKISFAKTGLPSITVDSEISLMHALLANGRAVASSCHGQGICSKCRLQIVAGAENLSPPTELEAALRERLSLPKDVRISCQAVVLGDVVVDAPYW